MIRKTLDTVELEEIYRLLAKAIDRVGAEKESLFLTKLAMMLANELGDIEFVRRSIDEAANHL